MPAVIDISNSRSPKKSGGKTPPPKSGPKPAVLIGIGVGLLLAAIFLIRFMMTSGADSNAVAPYNAPQKRNINGATGGAAGGAGATGSRVAPGLPGDGG
jgi:hypothetical protein